MKLKALFTIIVFLSAAVAIAAQNTAEARYRYQNILKILKDKIDGEYFDRAFGGVKVKENFKKAESTIGKATNETEMKNAIAEFLFGFENEHLFFLPPMEKFTVEHGWEMTFVGDKALVSRVDPDSDAAKKGVKPGDQIYMIEGFIPTRKELWKLRYQFEVLNPPATLNVILIKPNGNKYKVALNAKVTENKVFHYFSSLEGRDFLVAQQNLIDKYTASKINDETPGLVVWKLPSFQLQPVMINKLLARAEKAKALILDLRGNDEFTELLWTSKVKIHRRSGVIPSDIGLIGEFAIDRDDVIFEAAQQLIAGLLGREMTFGERKGRDRDRKLTTKNRGWDDFRGEVIVLVDSETSSASEILARVIQLEKRGRVIGDQTAGSVMETEFFSSESVININLPFSIIVPTAKVTLNDGGQLDGKGVTPDEFLIPTAADLAAGRDPVLARAAELLGYKMTPEKAGKVFEGK